MATAQELRQNIQEKINSRASLREYLDTILNPDEAAGFAMEFALGRGSKGAFDQTFNKLVNLLGIDKKSEARAQQAEQSEMNDADAIASGYVAQNPGEGKRTFKAIGRGLGKGASVAGEGLVAGAGAVGRGAAAAGKAVGREAVASAKLGGRMAGAAGGAVASQMNHPILSGIFYLVFFGFYVWAWSTLNPFWWVVGVAALIFAFSIAGLAAEMDFSTTIMVFVLLALHGWLFGLGYVWSFQFAILLAAALIAIIIVGIAFRPQFARSVQQLPLLGATLIAYAIPTFIKNYASFLPTSAFDIVVVMITIAPVWLLVMLNDVAEERPDGEVAALLYAYKVMIVIGIVLGFILYGVLSLGQYLPNNGISAIDAKTAFMDGLTGIKNIWKDVFTRANKLAQPIINPGAYYTGQVEQNKQAPLGVTIESLRPEERIVNNATPINIYGIVKAKSFVGDSLQVQPSCVIDKPGAPASIPDPANMEVLYAQGQSFQCTFPPLKSGSYAVTASVQFPFETWAYIPYTFVDQERARAIAKEGKDIHTVMSIPEQAVATYTSGPIIVGMGGSTMPVLVRPTQDPIIAPGTKIGITVDSGWQNGKLKRVDKVQLKVPKPFTISNCGSRKFSDPQPDDHDTNMMTYTFENVGFDTNTYSSITCDLNIPKGNEKEAADLVSTDKSTRSFIAVIDYTYVVTQKTNVQVQ